MDLMVHLMHFDVLIVGAGFPASALRAGCKSDAFRYPGMRSDFREHAL